MNYDPLSHEQPDGRGRGINGGAVDRIFAEHAPSDLVELGVAEHEEIILRSGIDRGTLLTTLALLPAATNNMTHRD